MEQRDDAITLQQRAFKGVERFGGSGRARIEAEGGGQRGQRLAGIGRVDPRANHPG